MYLCPTGCLYTVLVNVQRNHIYHIKSKVLVIIYRMGDSLHVNLNIANRECDIISFCQPCRNYYNHFKSIYYSYMTYMK